MSYPISALYSHAPNKGEFLSKIPVYAFEHITKKDRMCVIMISFSQPGFLATNVQCSTTLHDEYNGYKRTLFCQMSLLP